MDLNPPGSNTTRSIRPKHPLVEPYTTKVFDSPSEESDSYDLTESSISNDIDSTFSSQFDENDLLFLRGHEEIDLKWQEASRFTVSKKIPEFKSNYGITRDLSLLERPS